mgnify:CR=1 FL=1
MANQRTDAAGTHQEEAKRLVQKKASNNQALTVTPSRLGEKLSSKDQPDKSRLSLASSALPNHMSSNEKIEIKLARKLLESFSYCLRGDKAFDLVLQALDILKNVFGCQKATLYPLDFYVVKATTQNLNKERQKCIHQVEFSDKSDNSSMRLAAICKDESELCKTVLFSSLQELEDEILISEDGTKFAILMR